MDRYQQLLALSGECVKELDLNGSVTAVNANGLVLWQARDPSDVIGRAWTALWPGSAQVVVENAIARALRGERTNFEAACPDFAGEPRQWRVRVCPLFEQDRMVGVLAVSTDVTARNRAVRAAEVLQASSPLRAGMTGPASAIAPGGDAGREPTQASTESQLLASTAAYRQLEAMHEEAAVGHRFALAAQQAAELIATQAQKGEAVGQRWRAWSMTSTTHCRRPCPPSILYSLARSLARKDLAICGLPRSPFSKARTCVSACSALPGNTRTGRRRLISVSW
ncbi:PAS domain-containing protein [Xanthomonas sp. 60]